jgi:protein-ribulosamine 3-kinase
MASHAIRGDFELDKNIIAAIPKGYKVTTADSYGTSAWNLTARITTETFSGDERRFFVKCHEGQRGRVMMEGEYLGDLEMHKTVPEFGAKPLAWGQCATVDPPTWFILLDFYDMSNHLPEPGKFCSMLAEMHLNSVSPTGKFGFYVPAVQGYIAQKVDWNASWSDFYSTLLTDLMVQDAERSGTWPELEDAFQKLKSQVIPRLLGRLEEKGRKLKPCLIHGNLWEGNSGTDLETGLVKIYDSGSFYAHSELELGMWQGERIRFRSKVYTRQYLRRVGVSEPVEDFDDRLRLYSIKYLLVHSCHHAGSYVREKYDLSKS